MTAATHLITPTQEVARDAAIAVQDARRGLGAATAILTIGKPKTRKGTDRRTHAIRAAERMVEAAYRLLFDAEDMLDLEAGIE